VLNQNKIFNRYQIIFLAVVLLVVAADQLSKFWVRSNISLGELIPGLGFIQITYTQNTGAVFGILPGQSPMLKVVATIGAVVLTALLFFFYRRLPFLNNFLCRLSLALILGGTIGNLIDRFARGFVTDFIYTTFFATFNVADSAVTVGSIVFAFFLIRWGWLESSTHE